MLLLPVLIFLSVSLGVAGLVLWFAPTRTVRRVQALSTPQQRSTWVQSAVTLAEPFARLSTPGGNWEASPLRLDFIHAGIRHPDARIVYFAAKTLLPLILAGAVFLLLRAASTAAGLGLVFWLMLAALVGCYLPNLYLRLRIRARKREIFEQFPDAADLVLVCVEAGQGLDAALSRVADEMKAKSSALAEEMHLTNLEMRAGATREKALRNLALRTGVEEIVTFATMLAQADKFGTSIGDSLRVFSEDLRYKRQARAEEAAARIPIKMLFPLVVCIFPAIIMVIMGPAAIQVIRTVLPMISKGSV